MECPKCHSIINDNSTVCPNCHKVLLLECPNCHNLSESPVCSACGYTILVKCSKCSRLNPVTKEKCSKCGFPVNTSLAYQECESDDFASLLIKIESLKNIKQLLKSKELYSKFYYKLKNLLMAQVKKVDCKLIIYGDVFVINFSKELSFPTSCIKAARLAIKIANVLSGINRNIIEELGIPLNLNISILKKSSEKLQELTTYSTKVKPLLVKKDSKKYLKGLKIILDQYVFDEINKDYKTDSLYSLEENGKTVMFYEIILDSYVLPPSERSENEKINAKTVILNQEQNTDEEKDLYAFKVFDINAKCNFEKTNAANLIDKLKNCNLETSGKIIALKSEPDLQAYTPDLINFYKDNGYKVLTVNCAEALNFRPWGVLLTIFQEYFGFSVCNKFNKFDVIDEKLQKVFKPLFNLLAGSPVKAMSPEDARFNYMECWGKFLSTLKKTVIIIDGFEYIDDTTIQTLEIYFDKFRRVVPNFVFISSNNISVHSKFKGLLRTPFYTEFKLTKTSIDDCIALLKSDAANFIQSFYYEKIKENFSGSYLYFVNIIEYLKDSGVLIDFENKLIIKSKKSIIVPKNLSGLFKTRMKSYNKNPDISFILAYSSIFGARLDLSILEKLGIKDIEKNAGILVSNGIVRREGNILYINNFNRFLEVIKSSLKKDANIFLAKNIISQFGDSLETYLLAFSVGLCEMYKEEYLLLWKNSCFSIAAGDYDSYLKNCLGALSLVENLGDSIPLEQLEENKKDIYNNILMCLYSYSPEKIYNIENILLMDALKSGQDDKIVKLSNLMLQGALITSNYTNARSLLHNILSRMDEPTLLIDGAINTKFLLLLLVNIEILYNIGDFRECVETSEEILAILNTDILDKIKPAGFSLNLFVSHLMETFRLAALAKLYLMDSDLEDFLDKVKTVLAVELPEKDCILAVKDFLAGKVYSNGNMEEYSPFSKIVFLILQEFTNLKDDYKRFAQNIYQAKLLALEIHQKELELFCDLLIAYAYSKIGIKQKAAVIYKDVLEIAEKSAIFNILILARFFTVLEDSSNKALLIINDTLAMLQKQQNQAKIFYALFEILYIKLAEEQEISAVDIESEQQKLEPLKNDLKLLFTTFADEEL